jgi:hypothetical protein
MLGTWKVPVEEKVRKENHCPLAVDNASLASIYKCRWHFPMYKYFDLETHVAIY